MRHLLDTKDLTKDEALNILDTADYMAEVGTREVKKLPALRGRTVVNLFFEDSTRTRLSFEAAEKRLSADVINFSAKGSSVSKGESLKDTAQTLAAINADAVVIRHSASGAPQRLAEAGWIDAPVLNAGDGTHAHPTQALLDAMTLRQFKSQVTGEPTRGMDLSGMRVAIVGDILHSRVARSNLWLLNTLGAEAIFVAPPTLLPVGVENWPCEVFYNFDDALETRLDAVMLLRIQSERMHAAFFPSAEEYSRLWGLTPERFAQLDAMEHETAVLHPGPMNRGLEISAVAADSERSWVLRQVSNGVSVRMAVLYLLMTGGSADDFYPHASY
ncbi:aspartate carbamoyltransferase catalytic subunit [Rothia sp. ZJ1223]|uniref:aspartate carbamoyltransferase catalytic subunit n=1 Tax=Rothia sp. ZJ1223 TaxID=2811098 RepID=UPI00195EB6BC|nr:aspartate carbamoyltransferase catalytic subunit [Rothia sp. ZJ1223]MBM7050499.1 aspartate carbamoyltransferase catalytic subunit [Rothia sp. ZJ1223]